jgi:hypothetical protein
MFSNLLFKISKHATGLAIFSLLLAGSPAWAEDEAKCTVKTLQGDYGFHIDGVLLAIPGVALPPGGFQVRGVAMAHFDGKGNFSQVDHVVVNGTPPPIAWTPGSGTYKVNPDCTGSWILNVPGSPFSPVLVSFVVTRSGKEIRTVVEINAVTSVGVKTD